MMDPSERGCLRVSGVSPHPGSSVEIIDLVHYFQQGLPRPRLWQDAFGVIVKTIHSLEGST